MGCEFTEEVSLLVDGELAPHEAARLRAHIEGCAACEQAREMFLLLRQELRAYERLPDTHAQSNALAAILGSRTRGARETAPGWWERLGGAFGVRGLRPAHVATLALLLIATAVGLLWLAGTNTHDGARPADAPALANTNSRQPVRQQEVVEDGRKRPENSNAATADSPTVHRAETPRPPRPAGVTPGPRARRENAQVRRDQGAQRRTREVLSRDAPQETARVGTPALQPYSINAAPYAAGRMRAAADDPALRIGRHAERVERLLRSFRNARLVDDDDPTLDAAEARRLSKRLLYSNIALRREAAGAGDLSVKGWLDSLEPILIDISNLPDRPTPAAVGSIKERIRRRQLVGVLQAQAMLASKP